MRMSNIQFPLLFARLSLFMAILASAALAVSQWGRQYLRGDDDVINLFVTSFLLATIAAFAGMSAISRLEGKRGRITAWLGMVGGTLVMIPTGVIIFMGLLLVFSGPAH